MRVKFAGFGWTSGKRSSSAELIKHRGPGRSAEQVEIATLEYVDWFNHRRIYEACDGIPPAELEAAYDSHTTSLADAG